MNPSKSKTICEFNKSAGELVRLTLSEYKGRRYLSIWVFYDASETETPDWRPSKKGICLSVDLLDELKEAIDKVEACMNGGGRGPDQDAKAGTSREGQDEGNADE